jgi:hypothetical protein
MFFILIIIKSKSRRTCLAPNGEAVCAKFLFFLPSSQKLFSIKKAKLTFLNCESYNDMCLADLRLENISNLNHAPASKFCYNTGL